MVQQHVTRETFTQEYAQVFEGDAFWKGLNIAESTTYKWDEKSTYINKPPLLLSWPAKNTVQDLPGTGRQKERIFWA